MYVRTKFNFFSILRIILTFQIKQWSDAQNPRHALDDEDIETPLVPEISVKIHELLETSPRLIIIVPLLMKVILDTVKNKQIAGKIEVSYPQLATETEQKEEYDEDEQLYSALSNEATARKYQLPSIQIYNLSAEEPVFGIVVPHLTNPIAEKVLAQELARIGGKNTQWKLLAPCVLNNGTSLCRLDVGSELGEVPKLEPPHFVTGISAAVVSELAHQQQLHNVSVLVLNAEGHPGFEKVDADSIMDAAELVASTFTPDKTSYIKTLSQNVRRINSAATSGMYI